MTDESPQPKSANNAHDRHTSLSPSAFTPQSEAEAKGSQSDPEELRRQIREQFLARHPFDLDDFQRQALDALDASASVVVAAPTGSGKTVVAEYALAVAKGYGNRAFYTTPLKALSNQKYHDLCKYWGNDQVGLMTGDNVINPDAPLVVMTTEVLRNMIYAKSSALDSLQYVVLDEVHYLQNAYRGLVWEEVIIHLRSEVDLVCLSATVSNAEQLAEWIRTVRGSTEVIIEEHRPVTLYQHLLVGKKRSDTLTQIPTLTRAGKPNPQGFLYDPPKDRSPWKKHTTKAATPRRPDVVAHLDQARLLPAIYFVFSRNGCDDAIRQCRNAQIRLTTADERQLIREIAERHVEALSDDDLDVLEYDLWLDVLESGVASHHAGMVPPLKEAVEECFMRALVKVVFATETLALGINMPARSVVIESLSKFTGERHERLTPGEFTQLTGRAGRRGIDDIGHALVLWSPWNTFAQVASLASARTYTLTSSFRPTYNMAVNLVQHYPPDVARHLLNLSFAQFQADTAIVHMESRLEGILRRLDVASASASCDRGDIEVWRHRNHPERVPASTRATKEAIERAVRRLRLGDIIPDPETKGAPPVIVMTTSERKGHDRRLGMMNQAGGRFGLRSRDFFQPPRVLGHVKLPRPYVPSDSDFQRKTQESLVAFVASRRQPKGGKGAKGVGGCPELETHLNALDEIERLTEERTQLSREIKHRSESLARQFDRVLGLLRSFGYVDEWTLTSDGANLATLYSECDLLVAECLQRGVFDQLDAASLASLASVFTYESRRPDDRAFPVPTSQLHDRFGKVVEVWELLTDAEARAGVPMTRAPDPGLMQQVYDWASGEELGDILDEEGISGGDFVRNIKSLLDLLRQLRDVLRDEDRREASRAVDALYRDLIAASSTV